MKFLPFATALALVGATAADAGCAPRQRIIAVLADKYSEGRIGAGLAFDGVVLEVWANAETGTWTVTIMRPDGIMCAVASGTGWSSLIETVPEGDPA